MLRVIHDPILRSTCLKSISRDYRLVNWMESKDHLRDNLKFNNNNNLIATDTKYDRIWIESE